MSNLMRTDEIIQAYEAQQLEEQTIIDKKNDKIKQISESRAAAINRKEKIEEMKSKILEKRKLMKEKAEVDKKVKKTLNEDTDEIGEKEYEIEDEEDVIDDEDIIDDEEDIENVEDEEEVEEEEVDVKKESKQAILAKITERKKQDILKNIAERKAKAEGVQKVREKKEPVKEKKEVRVGTLLENVEGDKKRRFSVYREDIDSFYLRELGTKKSFKIKKEKVELTD